MRTAGRMVGCRRVVAVVVMVLFAAASGAWAKSWDVAPPDAAGAPAPPALCPGGDGNIQPADALIALRRAVGLVTDLACAGQDVPDVYLDVAPPLSTDGTVTPPRFVAGGDGQIDAADALLILREAVGLIELVPTPANLFIGNTFATIPERASLGDRDLVAGDFFPAPDADCEDSDGLTDCDCDRDGEFDGPEPVFLRVGIGADAAPPVPYDVCVWRDLDARDVDFDVPPLGNFPGPEDHDAGGDGQLAFPPPPFDACVTVCPEGFAEEGIECAEVELVGNRREDGILVRVGPVVPEGPLPPSGVEPWSPVVDPHHVVGDADFGDNFPLGFGPPSVQVTQCPLLAPDLVPTPALASAGRIEVLPPEPDQNDDIEFQVGISNEGNLRVDQAFDVDLYVDLFDVPGPFGVPKPNSPTPVPPGDSFRTVAASPEAPLLEGDEILVRFEDFDPTVGGTQPLNLGPGLHNVMVLVDSVGEFGSGAIEEEVEANNLFPVALGSSSGNFCVGTGAGFGSPDLAFRKVRFLEQGSDVPACDRQAGERVDLEITVANLDVDPAARDLGLSRPFAERFYEFVSLAPGCSASSDTSPCTSLDGIFFDCVPVGLDRAPIRAQLVQPLVDGTLRLELRETDFPAVPPDVNPSNNVVQIPLVNEPPNVDAGPARTGTVGVALDLDATVSDPNDVPAGSQPLAEISWSLVSQPEGSRGDFSDSATEDPSFTGNQPGTYVLQLTARDCPGAPLVSDTVSITLALPE